MKKYIYITADTNDGDYVSEKTEITDEQLELIKPVIQAIKDFKPYKTLTKTAYSSEWTHDHNYPTGECVREDVGQLNAHEYYVGKGLVTEEQLDTFDDMVAHSEFGIHTIESVEIIYVEKEEKLI